MSAKGFCLRGVSHRNVLNRYLNGEYRTTGYRTTSTIVSSSVNNVSTVELSPGSKVNVIKTPITESEMCWHCHGPITDSRSGKSLGVPYEIKKTEQGSLISSYGYYCCEGCEYGACIDLKTKFPKAEGIYKSIYNKLKIKLPNPNPPFMVRKCYGGTLSDVDYYKSGYHFTELPGYEVKRIGVVYQRILDTNMRDVILGKSGEMT